MSLSSIFIFIYNFFKREYKNLLDKGNDRPCIHQDEPLLKSGL